MDKTVQATEQANNASTIQVTLRSSISGEMMLDRPVVMVSTAQVADLRRCVARDVYCPLPFQLVLLHEQKPLEGCEHLRSYARNGKLEVACLYRQLILSRKAQWTQLCQAVRSNVMACFSRLLTKVYT